MDYYKIIHPATGKVVNLYSTDSSSAVANGTRLLLYTWLDNNDQKWGLDYVGDLVLMRLARDNSKVMNRHSGNNNAIVAKALNVREENFFTRAETPEDIIRLMIWYDWEHGCGGNVPIDTILLFDNFEEVEKLLKEWYSQKEKLRARTITRAKYLEWMLQ